MLINALVLPENLRSQVPLYIFSPKNSVLLHSGFVVFARHLFNHDIIFWILAAHFDRGNFPPHTLILDIGMCLDCPYGSRISRNIKCPCVQHHKISTILVFNPLRNFRNFSHLQKIKPPEFLLNETSLFPHCSSSDKEEGAFLGCRAKMSPSLSTNVSSLSSPTSNLISSPTWIDNQLLPKSSNIVLHVILDADLKKTIRLLQNTFLELLWADPMKTSNLLILEEYYLFRGLLCLIENRMLRCTYMGVSEQMMPFRENFSPHLTQRIQGQRKKTLRRVPFWELPS